VRGLLISDLRAAFVGDPAARNFPEILIGYPGVTLPQCAQPSHAGEPGPIRRADRISAGPYLVLCRTGSDETENIARHGRVVAA